MTLKDLDRVRRRVSRLFHAFTETRIMQPLRPVLFACAIATACLASAPVFAQQPAAAPSTATDEHPCRDEFRKLCGAVEAGEGRRRECVQQHMAELSPACQARAQRMLSRAPHE